MAGLPLPEPEHFTLGRTTLEGKQTWNRMLGEWLQRASLNILTIASGALTPAAERVYVQPETGSADNLDRMEVTAVYDGMIVWLSTSSASNVVTIRHAQTAGEGRIQTADGANIDLDDPRKIIGFRLTSGIWEELPGRLGAGPGGGNSDTGQVTVAATRTASFTVNLNEVNKITPLDTTSGSITVTIPPGLSTPAGSELLMFFRKLVAASLVIFAAAGAGDGSTPPLYFDDEAFVSSDSATVALTGTEPIFTTGHPVTLGAGTNVCLFVDVFVNYKDTGTRTLLLNVDGANVAWTNSAVHALADDAPCVFHYRLPMGDIATTATKTLKLVNPTSARSCLIFIRAATGVNQSTPTENIDINFDSTATTTSTKSVVTTGSNRRVFYAAAGRRINSVASISGCTQIAAITSTGVVLNASNMTGAYGHEAAAAANTYDATHQFTIAIKWARCNYAIRPTAGGGGVEIKTRANVAPNVADVNAEICVAYDGNSGIARVLF